MTIPKKIIGELRAYIHWGGRWRHIYIIATYDHVTLTGEIARMIEFKLDKRSKDTLSAEKSKFHKTKPKQRARKVET